MSFSLLTVVTCHQNTQTHKYIAKHCHCQLHSKRCYAASIRMLRWFVTKI